MMPIFKALDDKNTSEAGDEPLSPCDPSIGIRISQSHLLYFRSV